MVFDYIRAEELYIRAKELVPGALYRSYAHPEPMLVLRVEAFDEWVTVWMFSARWLTTENLIHRADFWRDEPLTWRPWKDETPAQKEEKPR